jgi:hypothetical protein
MKVDGAQAVTFKGEKGGGGRDSSVFIGAVARCDGGGNKGGRLGWRHVEGGGAGGGVAANSNPVPAGASGRHAWKEPLRQGRKAADGWAPLQCRAPRVKRYSNQFKPIKTVSKPFKLQLIQKGPSRDLKN